MREVEAFEATSKLGILLDFVQQGEQVVITQHGKPVARLVPEVTTRDRTAAKAAVERIRARARTRAGDPIGIDEWKGFRDEGRT